ncbi:MAG: enoyl-CoA hydratase/isomerase family protein [Pseudomonadota bacterium]
MNEISVERRGRIAIVRFDRGNRANALSLGLMRGLTATARSFEGDYDLSAVILTGRDDNFALGFDLKDAETEALATAGLAERRAALQTGGRMCEAWTAIDALTISVVEGWCVGGGVALAVSTDLRVLASDAALYAPEIERGMNMSWGSVPRIVNLIGPARAKRMLALAEKVPASAALDWGLADEVSDDPMAAALMLAERAAAMPPVALRMVKQGVDAYANALAAAASQADYDQFALTQTGEDYAEGIASFLKGRPARFTGR